MIPTRRDRCARARAKPHLGETGRMNSVRPISAMIKQRFSQANSARPIAHFGETEMLQKGNREFTLQSCWDRSLTLVGPKRYEGKQRDYNPISVRPRSLSVRPICLGFVAVAMTSELGGAK